MFAKSELLQDFIEKFEKASPIALNYDHHKPNVRDWIHKQIREFYFASHPTVDKQLNVTNVKRHFSLYRFVAFWSGDLLVVNSYISISAKFYCPNTAICNDPIIFSIFRQLFGDGWFLSAMDLYLRARFANKASTPTYAFLYTHDGASSFTEYYQGDAETSYGRAPFYFSLQSFDYMSAVIRTYSWHIAIVDCARSAADYGRLNTKKIQYLLTKVKK